MKIVVFWKRAVEFIKDHPVSIGFVSIILLYFLVRLSAIAVLPIFFDESIYIRWSQEALRNGDLLISLTDGKPPLHTWSMIPFLWLFKDPLMAGRIASVLFGAVTTSGIILIGKELDRWNTGLLAGLLYVLCPFTLWYDRVAVAEGLLLATFTIAILFALRAAKSLSYWYVLPVGALTGLALMTKGTALLLFIIIPFAFLGRKKEEGKGNIKADLLKWAGIVFSSVFLGYGIYSLLRFSGNFDEIAVRTGVTTRTLSEVLADPIGPFFLNFAEIFKTLIIFVTPLVLAAAAAGLIIGFLRKNRYVYFLLGWIGTVWLVESIVAEHWMFDRILPRFFLVIVPPLLLLASVFLCHVFEWFKAKDAETGRRSRFALSALVVIALLAFPVYSDALIVFDPSSAPLPESIRFQYITDWPSGWGMREIVDYIERESEEDTLIVGSNLDGIGLPTDGLELYLSENTNVGIVPFNSDEQELPGNLLDTRKGCRAYCVYNMFDEDDLPPDDWPLKLIRKYPKDGNDRMYMLLYEVI